MKKLYTIALAAGIAFTAAAASPQMKVSSALSHKQITGKAMDGRIANNLRFERIIPADGPSATTQGYDEATKTYSIEGQYKLVIGDYYFQDSAGAVELTVDVTVEDGLVWFEESAETYFLSAVPAEFNTTTNKLTFFQVKIGKSGSYYVLLSPFVWNNETTEIELQEEITATFDPKTGSITFLADNGISWNAFQDENYTNFLGYSQLFDLMSAAQFVEDPNEDPLDEEQAGQWKTVGTATITDAWITPSYSLADGSQIIPAEHPFEAELQQNVDNQNRYRVWRPFHSEKYILVSKNDTQYNGQIVFDITDPEHVIVEAKMPAGFKNNNGEFYCYGMLGWQIATFGDRYTESLLPAIIEFMESKAQPFDTYSDGVLSVNRSVFDFAASCEKAYTWNGNEYVVSTFKFDVSSVDEIAVIESENNAPVEYFNLQGQRVNNPVAGQLIIKRQGAEVTKVLVK